MADKIKIRRGLFADLPDLDEGELGYVKDRGTVYIGTNTDHNILLNPILVAEDGYTIDGYLYPAIDNVHGLGTPDKRWKSVSVGPGSLHIISKSTDVGYTEDNEFVIGIDPSTNKLQIASGSNVLIELDPSTGASFPSGGTIDATNATETEHYQQQQQFNQTLIKALDGYAADLTVTEHYQQLSIAIDSLRQAADAYGAGGTEQEHYVQQQQFNQTVIQSLDGYAVVPNTNAIGDGYISFFIDGGKQLAGDNDLYFDRSSNTLTLGGGGTYVGSSGTASNPTYATGSSNTGIFQDGSGNLAFTIGGTQYFQMTGAGTITTTAGGLMQLAQGNLVNVTYASNAGSNTGIYFPSGSIMAMAASGNEIARISSGPNLFNVNGNLHVSGAINNEDLSETLQAIQQAADGYATVPNTASIGDGYISFFIDGGRQLAGDNDLFYDRVNGRLGINTSTPTHELTVDGYITPATDNIHGLGTPTQRWRNIVVGPSSLHLVTTNAETTIGRNWVIGVGTTSGNIGNFQIYESSTDNSLDSFDITPSGLVGFGVSNPMTKLHVVRDQNNGGLGGSTLLLENINAGGLGDAGVVFRVPTKDWFIGIDNDNSDSFRIAADNEPAFSDAFTITTGANVGISTVLPVARLEVEDNATTSSMVMKITHDDHNVYGLVIGNDTFSTTDTDGMAMYVDNSGVSVLDARGTAFRLSIQVGGTDRIRITNTGLVGLSTASPQNRLDVEGAVAIGATYSGTNVAPTNGLLVEGNIGVGITTVGSTQVDVTQSTSSTVVSGVDISNDGTGDAFIRFGLGATRGYSMGIDNSDSDALKIGTAANTGSGVDTGTFMVMTTAGSVGVGGTPINGKFEVNTALDEAVVATAYASVSGTSARGVIQARANGGGVIMGMNNTTHSAYTRGGEAMNGAAEIVTFNAGDAVTKLLIGNVNASPIHFIINDTKAATISADRNFGIGTSTPIEALTVVGAIAVNENVQPATQDGYGKIWVNSNGELNFVDDNGSNVLITNGGVVNAGAGVQRASGFTGVDGYIAFWTGSNEVAGDNDLFFDRVNNSLGIGNSTPQTKLHVTGDGYFEGSVLLGGQIYYSGMPITAPPGTTVTLDFDTSAVQVIDLGDATGNVTVSFSNLRLGASYIIKIIQDVSTPRNIVWPGNVKWQFGSTPTISTGSLAVDIVTGVYDGTNFYANIGQAYA